METWLYHLEEFKKIRQEADVFQSVLPQQTQGYGVGFHWEEEGEGLQNKCKEGGKPGMKE